MRTMKANSRLDKILKTGLHPECAAVMTKLENTMVKPHEDKRDYEKLCGNMPGYRKCLRTFEEIGFISIIFNVKSKLEDQVITFIFKATHKTIQAVHTTC